MTTFNVLDYTDKSTTRVPLVTDDSSAFEAMLADSKNKALNDTPHFELPPGFYYITRAINLHQTVKLFGPGGNFGNQNSGAVILCGPNAVSGMVVHEDRTTDDGGASSQPSGLGDASGSIISGVTVWGPGAQFNGSAWSWTNPNAKNREFTCLWDRTYSVEFSDITVAFSSGPGIRIEGFAGASGEAGGQASVWTVRRLQGIYNALAGMSIIGSDANIGASYDCSFISNGGSGIEERSFLGNNHFSCHTRDNGQYDPIGSGALNGSCQYGGLTYYLVAEPDEATQRALASTTVPGTNDNVWRRFDIANSQFIQVWTPGQTWRIAGAYTTIGGNTNANNVFTGCYAELGQPRSQATAGTLFVGGSVGALGFDPTSTCTVIAATGSGLASNRGFTVFGKGNRQMVFGTPGDGGLAGTLFGVQSDDGLTNYEMQYDDSNSQLYEQYNHSYIGHRITLAKNKSKHGPFAHVFAKPVSSLDTRITEGRWVGSVENPGPPFANAYSSQNDLVGRSVNQGDEFSYVGADYTGSWGKMGMGLKCTKSGIVADPDPMKAAVLVEFGEPVNPLRVQDLAFVWPNGSRPGQPVTVSDCAHQNIGQSVIGGGDFLVRAWWNKTQWNVIGV